MPGIWNTKIEEAKTIAVADGQAVVVAHPNQELMLKRLGYRILVTKQMMNGIVALETIS